MIKLRPYRWNDQLFVEDVLEEVQSLYQEILPGFIKGLKRYFQNRNLEPLGCVQIIEYNGENVGWISQLKRGQNQLYISHFYILSKYQGLGIGSRVLKFSMNTQRNLGVQTISVDAHMKMPRVISFYKRNEFRQSEDMDDDKSEHPIKSMFIKLVYKTVLNE